MKIRNSLVCKNIKKRPARSASLILLAAFLSFFALAGSLIVGSLQNGFDSLQSRLGADIMVVPYEASTKSDLQNIVLQGNTGYFYMNSDYLDEIAQIEGIDQITAQYFLASVTSGCCSIPVQIIGFDPETDFAIQPWIGKSTGKEISYLDVVAGYNLNAFVGDTLSFYGVKVHVAAKLQKTGTSFDTAVFTTKDTIKTLIDASLDKNLNTFANINSGKVISCILINAKDGYEVDDILNDINIHYKKLKAVRTTNLISNVADSLSGISDITRILIALVWVIALCVMLVAFSMMTNERKKEFAILRVIGASRGMLSRTVLAEGIGLCVVGSLCGVIAALGLVLPFSTYIEQRLGLPFLLPKPWVIAGIAIAAILFAVVAGALASWICARRIARMDTGTILRSGE